jgi:hypothetical protein
MSIEITHDQANALASLSERLGALSLHQLTPEGDADPGDVYATPVGSSSGYRVSATGALSPVGDTLPA